MRLYLLKRTDDSSNLGIYAEMSEAVDCQDGDPETEIEEVSIGNTAKDVCDFINRRFGVSIFEN